MRDDPYPSRVADRPAILPRRDPVVWGDGSGGPLDARTLEQFAAQGFLIRERLFDDAEVAALSAELDRLRADPSLRGRPEVIVEPGPEPDGDGGVADGGPVRSVFRVHEISPVFARLIRDPRLADVARQLLGGPVYVHQSRINYKPGLDGKEFFWHSDFETWHVEDGMPRMRAVSVAIALTENTAFNGPLLLVTGSHRRFVSCVGATPDDHYKMSLRRQDYGVPDRDTLRALVDDGGMVAAVGPPGTVIVFDCNAMHGSARNMSPYPRSNVFLVYNSVDNALGPPWGDKPPRPEFIASRRVAPV